MATFESSLKAKLIYVFAINDDAHSDCLKIGETTLDDDNGEELYPNCELYQKAAHNRIRQYTSTAGIAYQLLYTCSASFNHNGLILSLNDKQIHRVLERSGIKQKEFAGVKGADEWYCCDLETIKKAIAAAKRMENSLKPSDITQGQSPVKFRPEQSLAIEKTRKQFQKGNQMLWNAKMRFGKTLSALQVVKEEGFKRTLILTHRPVVDEGWFDDFKKIFYDSKEYRYGSKNNGELFGKLEQLAARGDKYVYFASMQDLRGSEQVGGKFDKNNELFSTSWNFVIVDEAHEGTKTELGQNVLKEIIKPTTKVLQLSGTPFNLFDDYDPNEIFTWDYVMEQKAKQKWATDNPYEPNPYASLPAINIYTYDLGNLMSEYIGDEKAFNFHEFFRTKEDGEFVHDKDVDNFLDLLCKNDKDSLYPFSNEEFRRLFRHTLWVVPGVKAAKALSTKIRNHEVFGKFKPVNVAGNGDEDEENEEALQMVNKAIGPNPDETYTITITCTRLRTGVSIRPWTAVFMLAGSFYTSAAQYMQTIFRVQTPYVNNGRMKENCYAFDFAPDRTLRVLAETAKVSTKAGKQSEDDRKILGDFLNFCPIISIEGSKMTSYDVNKMMGQLKRAQIEKVVQCGFEDGALYNDELLKLTDVELRDFEELKNTIGTTKAMAKTGDIDVNNQGFTQEQYEEKESIEKKPKKERTPEEQARLDELKAMSNQRKNAISILRGISIRMPLLIYGAELKNEDEEITINNFASLIDDKSWEEFMPKGVDKEKFEKFKKYYEPDVFREAGKRIREMARAADKFSIEERIERIATIFNTFRNPDKETVLTPWRVVNMHMSDCLGGWCFYGDSFDDKEMLSVPRYIDRGKVTKDVFRTDSHILEINSKSGLYPLYVAYNIYRARVEEAKKKYGEVGLGFSKSIWDATIEENILVVSKTPMAKSITKRTLAGFRDTKVNAQYYPNLIENITERPEAVVNTFRDGKHFWKINDNTNMKLDAIVGNPPYQLTGGSGGSNDSPIYQYFCLLGFDLKPQYASFIIPSRWFSAGREALIGPFRSRMQTCGNIAYMKNNTNGRYFFPTVELKGGVCYFRYDKNYNGKCNYTFINHGDTVVDEIDLNRLSLIVRDPRIANIVEKVFKKMREDEVNSVDTIISGDTPFGIPTNPLGSSKTPFPVYSNMDKDHDVMVYYIEKQKRKIAYVSKADIRKNSEDINKAKVFMPKASGSGNDPYVIGDTIIAPENSVCSQTFVYSAFDNQKTAKNFDSYIKTKFVRILVASIKITQDCLSGVFRFVPLQDFSKPWTDAELYAKYKLTEDEIAFIESMIKPME